MRPLLSSSCLTPRTLRGLVLLFGVAVCVLACGKSDGGGSQHLGALHVIVHDSAGALVPEASVTTDPETSDRVTDAAGAALIRDVKPGFYRVVAEHDVAGVASRAVSVEADELSTVTLALDGRLGSGSGGSGPSGSGASGSGPGGSGASGSGASGGGSSTGGLGGTSGAGGASSTSEGGSAGAPVIDFIDVGTQVEAMLVDPKRPYLYALDRVNNEFLFVNLETAEVETTIFVGSTPVDMDLTDDGNEVFVVNFGSTEIAIVDLEAQEVGRTIFVDPSQSTWDGNPYRLALTAGNTLVYTSEDQWNDVKLVSAETGVFLAVAGDVYQPDLTASPDGTQVFAAESGSTGSRLHRFDVTATSITEVDESPEAGSFGSRLAVISGDGEYVFYAGQKILASNLQSVRGQFSEVVQASNYDGTVVAGTTNIFDGETFAVIAPLRVSTSVMAMSADDSTLYLYDVNTSRIYAQDLTAL